MLFIDFMVVAVILPAAETTPTAFVSLWTTMSLYHTLRPGRKQKNEKREDCVRHSGAVDTVTGAL
jgi:hypothetical protein